MKISHNGFSNIIEIVTFALVNLWIGFILFYIWNESFRNFLVFGKIQFLDTFSAKISGIVIIISGFWFFISALKELGCSWRLGIDEKHPGKLVTGGIYTFFRHPIYIFFDLYFLGIFILNRNIIFLVFAASIFALMHLQMLQEEKFLYVLSGEKYREYCLQTGRYLSWKKIFKKPEKDKPLLKPERSSPT
ncbi:MAG: isoprenylcysteine carboxylmethyltransferase family protein [Actinobacteria bacterium]|nr:isoprenylcysteine carboxylmethyltransferase family protein [Actinomycetota bacterium]